MSKLPALSGKEVVAALERAGFSVIRTRSSHHFLRHPDGRTTVVPVHAGEGFLTVDARFDYTGRDATRVHAFLSRKNRRS